MVEISTLPHHLSGVWAARIPEENYSGMEINQFWECKTAEGIRGWGKEGREKMTLFLMVPESEIL